MTAWNLAVDRQLPHVGLLLKTGLASQWVPPVVVAGCCGWKESIVGRLSRLPEAVKVQWHYHPVGLMGRIGSEHL